MPTNPSVLTTPNSDIVVQELTNYADVAARAIGRDRRSPAGTPQQQLAAYLDAAGRSTAWTGDDEAPFVKMLAGRWTLGAFNAVAGAIILAQPGRLGRISLLNLDGTGNDFRYVLLIDTTAKALADIVLGTNASIIWRGVLPPADQISAGTLPGVYEASFSDIGGLPFYDGIAFAISTSSTSIAAGGQTCSGNVAVGGL